MREKNINHIGFPTTHQELNSIKMPKENTIETLKNPKPQFSDEGLLPPRKPISQLEVKKMDKIIRESQPENEN
jgi:hypothetical protein